MALRLLQTLALLLYAAMIVGFYGTGRLAFLVHPIYNKLILAGGLLLLGIGLYMAFTLPRWRGHAQPFGWRQAGQWLLLALPLAFAVLFSPRPLSSHSAILRGLTQDLSAGEDFSPQAFGKPPQERGIVEWVRLLNYDPEPAHYAGQPVSLEGMVLVDDSLPAGIFYISRFLLTCCAADARSVVLPVRYDPARYAPVADQWIRLEGEMGEGTLNGQRQAVIEHRSHQSIDTPDNPYAD